MEFEILTVQKIDVFNDFKSKKVESYDLSYFWRILSFETLSFDGFDSSIHKIWFMWQNLQIFKTFVCQDSNFWTNILLTSKSDQFWHFSVFWFKTMAQKLKFVVTKKSSLSHRNIAKLSQRRTLQQTQNLIISSFSKKCTKTNKKRI